MKVTSKGSTNTLTRGRKPYRNAEIERAVKALKNRSVEVVLDEIRVVRYPHAKTSTINAKMLWRNRIVSIARKLNKEVSVRWVENASGSVSPVIAKK